MKKRSNLIFQAFINLQSMRFMMSVYLVLVISMLFVIPTIAADPGSSDAQQNITVSGTVIDAEGVPMPGVSISVKGTSMGVNTDVSGKYTVKGPFTGVNPCFCVCRNEGAGDHNWQSGSYRYYQWRVRHRHSEKLL